MIGGKRKAEDDISKVQREEIVPGERQDEVKERLSKEKGKKNEKGMNSWQTMKSVYRSYSPPNPKIIQVFKRADATLPQKGYKG